jgi:hypothetical protein
MAQRVKVIGPPYDELVVDTGHLVATNLIADGVGFATPGTPAATFPAAAHRGPSPRSIGFDNFRHVARHNS